jgi:hypothetical protein
MGRDGGGRPWVSIVKLLQTAKMEDIDLHASLPQALVRIANGWPNADKGALMSWNYSS